MTAFSNEQEVRQRLDYDILKNGAVTLYFRPAILQHALEWFSAHHYRLHEFNCAEWESEAAFHDDVSRGLGFPEYYGRNLAAFNDCLSDLEIPEDGGVALLFLRYDLFAKRCGQSAQAVLDIIATKSRHHLLTGGRFVALVQSDDPAIEFEPVGACPVMWNRKEWLDASRGV